MSKTAQEERDDENQLAMQDDDTIMGSLGKLQESVSKLEALLDEPTPTFDEFFGPTQIW